jgi:2-polyprenyl-6-methoxyphenol hydroxylase-like FAD-dependent oxidoreductase
MIGQPEVERALLAHLDIPVLYSTPVESVEDTAEVAITRCHNLTVTSKYIVAADGAHSQTRKQLGIKFQGEKPNMRWAVLDTFLRTDFPVCDEIISLEKDGQSRVAWIPRFVK